MKLLDNITPQEKKFEKWYQDVVVKGNLIHYGNTQGSMIFKPNSFGIWENIQNELNAIFRKQKIQNVYLPLLIPKELIEKEKKHIKGFAPELATVTLVGNKELEKPLVIRPTSEMLFGELFQKEISSYKDLPKIFNQWANILRWEKKTNPFLRNREFLWQEGHTSHATSAEARKFSRKMIKIYANFMSKYLAIPVVIGKKTSHEKFAGAVTTYTIEAMMKDGRALQAGTSHYLGQNFSKAINITFKNKLNQIENVFQSSWGVSTRLIGAIIMTHGDNRGIIIPPWIAPNQIDIIEIFPHKNPIVKKTSEKLFKSLNKKYRVRVDDTEKGPGFKAAQSEIEGTPLRIEIGPRDLEENMVTIVRRDTLEKIRAKIEDVKDNVKTILKEIQDNLLNQAQKRLEQNIVEASSYEEFKELINKRKFVVVPFAGNSKDEENIKSETGASTRCIPLKYSNKKQAQCILTKKLTKRWVIFARAY